VAAAAAVIVVAPAEEEEEEEEEEGEEVVYMCCYKHSSILAPRTLKHATHVTDSHTHIALQCVHANVHAHAGKTFVRLRILRRLLECLN
jgi:hypothetical protein